MRLAPHYRTSDEVRTLRRSPAKNRQRRGIRMCSGNSKRTKYLVSSERREAWRDDLPMSGPGRGGASGRRETP